MAEVHELSDADKEFLYPYLPPSTGTIATENASGRAVDLGERDDSATQNPFVTLTYACSLDSMISLAPGVRTTLSGPETKSMTHYLRLHHDAILVGVGTASADDPSLNCRYPGATLDSQPRPIVLDPSLRWDISGAKVKILAAGKKAKAPWIIHSPCEVTQAGHSSLDFECLPVGEDGLQTSDANFHERPHKLSWRSILKTLGQKGIGSVMIEGGAKIINDLLSEPDLVDSMIVTIAPTWLGQGGIAVSPAPKAEAGQRVNAAHLEDTAWLQFGHDVVLCGRLKR